MARIRYLKPDFFKDEDVGRLPYEARLFFQGLWGMADKAGRLEDRPERLKVELMPYDSVDAEEILQRLTKPKKSGRPFIIRYEVNRERFIQIVGWAKHQRPHPTEKESSLPPPPTGKKPLKKGYITVKKPLNKGCITLGMGTEKGMGMGTERDGQNKFDPLFETFWKTYPRRIDKQESKGLFLALAEKGLADDIIKATKGYLNFLKSKRIHENFDQEPMHPPKFLTNEVWREYSDEQYHPPM